MPLPADDTRWPPESMAGAYSKMQEWAAWYSGEPDRIIDVYAPMVAGSATATQLPWWRFWSRARGGSNGSGQRALLHVPIASDLAAVSGALLFGDPPKIRVRPSDEAIAKELAQAEERAAAEKAAKNQIPIIPKANDPDLDKKLEANAKAAEAKAKATGSMASMGASKAAVPEDGDDPMQAGAQPAGPQPAQAPTVTPEQKAERRILDIIERGDFYSRLVEAAETGAAIGGVYIYPVWDKDLRDVPLMAIAQSDMAVPTFKWGILTEVTFWKAVEVDGHKVLRHVEYHGVEGTGDYPSRKAIVLNGLYEGTVHSLGKRVGLGAHPSTAKLEARVELPFPELDVEYVPNIKPNRLWRSAGWGVADIQGSETLLDGLDEVYASWMRDVRLAKARIIVPRDYLRLDEDDPNGGMKFDVDQEIYTTMDMEPGLTQDARAMLAHQFQIRYAEHRDTAMNFIERIVSNAGYVPSTLGASSESKSVTTGTALRISEHKSLLTLRKKSGWWRTAIANLLYHMMLIDIEVFKTPVEAFRPSVITTDSILDNPLELAQTALALKTAESASVETRVRMVHPDWSASEVAAEVARIKDDLEAAKPPPPPVIGGGGKFGNPGSDPASTGEKPQDPSKGQQDSPPPASPPFAKRG